ncbi:MAG TPA: selenocysteine-specific translation elongation factor [Solirubrobacterales bacterium]
MTLGTAGHIDHGKTALIEALTGKNTDRLAEERRRGISIELGYARLDLPGGRSVSVIDVPGHEALVRTMVAGATGIDLFLMVIAADEGVMPQTREHLTVLRALEVPVGLIALSRCDLAEPARRELSAAEARELIDAPLVEVSAVTGEGLGRLRDELAAAAERAEAARPAPRWEQPPVLHVDRVFTLRGIGTVVTGTLWSGSLAAGQIVEVLPDGAELRVRSVQVHDRPVDRAERGQRVALNLVGPERDRIERGDVISSPGSGLRPSYRLDVRLSPAFHAEDRTRRVQVHHGTRRAAARVVPLDEGDLAQLRLESPLIARAGDRLVLRSIAPVGTLGGGEVIDPAPARHGPGSAADRLCAIAEGSPEELLELALGDGVPDDPERWMVHPLLGPSRDRFGPETWRSAIDALLRSGRARERGGSLVPPDAEPEPRAQPSPEPGGRAMRVLAAIREDGVSPRAPAALAEELGLERAEAEVALAELAASGRAVRVKPDVYYDAELLAELRDRLLALAAERDGTITLAEARDELGTSRKYAQALLEHLDASHLTVRREDRHVLRRAAREGVVRRA